MDIAAASPPMTDILSPERIAEIEARANAATEGPWAPLPSGHKKWVTNATTPDAGWLKNRDNDAAFVAAARADVPDLIASHRALAKRIKALEAEHRPEVRRKGRKK